MFSNWKQYLTGEEVEVNPNQSNHDRDHVHQADEEEDVMSMGNASAPNDFDELMQSVQINEMLGELDRGADVGIPIDKYKRRNSVKGASRPVYQPPSFADHHHDNNDHHNNYNNDHTKRKEEEDHFEEVHHTNVTSRNDNHVGGEQEEEEDMEGPTIEVKKRRPKKLGSFIGDPNAKGGGRRRSKSNLGDDTTVSSLSLGGVSKFADGSQHPSKRQLSHTNMNNPNHHNSYPPRPVLDPLGGYTAVAAPPPGVSRRRSMDFNRPSVEPPTSSPPGRPDPIPMKVQLQQQEEQKREQLAKEHWEQKKTTSVTFGRRIPKGLVQAILTAAEEQEKEQQEKEVLAKEHWDQKKATSVTFGKRVPKGLVQAILTAAEEQETEQAEREALAQRHTMEHTRDQSTLPFPVSTTSKQKMTRRRSSTKGLAKAIRQAAQERDHAERQEEMAQTHWEQKRQNSVTFGKRAPKGLAKAILQAAKEQTLNKSSSSVSFSVSNNDDSVPTKNQMTQPADVDTVTSRQSHGSSSRGRRARPNPDDVSFQSKASSSRRSKSSTQSRRKKTAILSSDPQKQHQEQPPIEQATQKDERRRSKSMGNYKQARIKTGEEKKKRKKKKKKHRPESTSAPIKKSKKRTVVAPDISTPQRSEALEELASNVKDTLDMIQDSFGEGIPDSSPLISNKKRVRALVAQQEDARRMGYNADEFATPNRSGLKWCKLLVVEFDRLIAVLCRLSDELELSGIFGNESLAQVVSSDAINAVLSHMPIVDQVFTELRPVIMTVHDSNQDEEEEDGKAFETSLGLERAFKLVKMITELAGRATERQEWDARSETCLVTLLELLQWTSHELHCLYEDDASNSLWKPTLLARAWTASGHTNELLTIDSSHAEDSWIFRQVCYEVIVSTDHWCPNIQDLREVCDIEEPAESYAGGKQNGTSEDSFNTGLDYMESEEDENDGRRRAEVPRAAFAVLDKIEGPPLARRAIMSRILRRILPPEATSDPSLSGENLHSTIRSMIDSSGETHMVSISSLAEVKTDPNSRSMGGVGKTTAAAMLASRPDIRRCFHDGIAWLHLGNRPPGNITYEYYVVCLREICRQLPFLRDGTLVPQFQELIHVPGEKPVERRRRDYQLMNVAFMTMSKLLRKFNIMIVLDDVVWKKDIHWFRFHPPSRKKSNSAAVQQRPVFSVLLITTRIRTLLTAANTVELDLLDESEATSLLLTEAGLPVDHVMASSIEAQSVVRDCANHPLAVQSAGRWLGLKYATAGVVGSVEETQRDVSAAIQTISRSNGGNMMFELLSLSFSPSINGKPTNVIKLCFAAFITVFCSEQHSRPNPRYMFPMVPFDVTHILFDKILELEASTLFENDDKDKLQNHREAAKVLIPQALSALHVVRTTDADMDSNIDKDSDRVKYMHVQHDIHQEYGDYLSSQKSDLGNMARDAERRWNRAFVAAYVETRGESHWDDEDPDPCRRYALEMIVTHMLRADMMGTASNILKDESFVRGRLMSMGHGKGTKRHIRDCEALGKCLKEVQKESTEDLNSVVELGCTQVSELLIANTIIEDPTGENRAQCVEIGFAHCELGSTLADVRLWGQAISQWNLSKDLLLPTLGAVEPIAAILYNEAMAYLEMNENGKALEAIKQCRQIRGADVGEAHALYALTMQKLGDVFLGMSDYVNALESYEKAMEVMTTNADTHRISIGKILHSIGRIHHSRGDLEEAVACYEDALASLRGSLGDDSPELGPTYERLGAVYSDRGETSEAIEHLEEALRLTKLVPDGSQEIKADVLSIEGMIFSLKGEQEKGLERYESALGVLKTSAAHKKEKIATLLHLIACVYLVKGENKTAMKLFESSLHTRKKQYGFIHLDVGSTLFNMSYLHQIRSKYSKALKCLDRALEIRKMHQPDSEKVSLTLEKIGALSKLTGKLKKSEVAYEEALRIRRKLFGEKDLSVAAVLHEMGDLMDDIGEFDEAITCFTACLETRRLKLGESDPLVAQTLYSMGFTYHNKDENDDAIACFEEALAIRKDALGPESKEVGDTLNILGFLLAKTGAMDEALTNLWEAFRLRKDNNDLIKASDTLKNIGNVHREQRRYDESIECYNMCLDIRRGELGDQDEKCADAIIAIANCRSDLDDHDGAMLAYEKALTIRIGVHGANDIRVAQILMSMGTMEFKAGDASKAKNILEEYIRVRKENKTLPPDADYVNVLFIVGNINKMQGRDFEARTCWSEAYELFNRIGLAKENPQIAKVMDNLLRGGDGGPKIPGRAS